MPDRQRGESLGGLPDARVLGTVGREERGVGAGEQGPRLVVALQPDEDVPEAAARERRLVVLGGEDAFLEREGLAEEPLGGAVVAARLGDPAEV